MTCDKCGNEIIKPEGSCSTGYGLDQEGNKVCYACCAVADRQALADGHDPGLYLTEEKDKAPEITNWPGSLRFTARIISRGKHYILSVGYVPRVDAHFTDQTGRVWLATVRGDMQLARCKRLAA